MVSEVMKKINFTWNFDQIYNDWKCGKKSEQNDTLGNKPPNMIWDRNNLPYPGKKMKEMSNRYSVDLYKKKKRKKEYRTYLYG
jgi:hypothetical protein